MRGRKKFGWREAGFALWCAALTLQPGGVAAQSAPAAEPESSSGWAVPPIRWGGSLATDLRAQSSGDQRRVQLNEMANFRVASYVWQPWIAVVSGGLGLATSKERRGDGPEAVAAPARTGNSAALSGNAEATLFPVSRFPFHAYFNSSDSRASGEQTLSDYTNKRFGVRQSYSAAEGGANYAASFDRSALESASFGRDTVNAFAASMNQNLATQAFDASANHALNTRSNTGERTSITQLTGRYSYRPESDFTVESLASANHNAFRLLAGGAPSENRSSFMQANTFATWRPADDSPLFVSGGLRLFRSEIGGSSGDSDSATLSANLGANYALDRQTSIAGSAVLTHLASNGANRLLSTQTASVTYTADPRSFGGFSYGWNSGANASNQTGLAEGGRFNLGGRLEHSVRRELALGEGSQISFSLGQAAAASADSATASSTTLGHNASASWRLSQGAATSAFVSANGADSRTSGHNANRFQLINLQASGQAQFGGNSSIALNLTMQGVRQGTPATPDARFSFNTSGNLHYSHLRALGVPRLRYTALASLNESQFRQRLQGDFNAPREQVTRSLEQRFDYSIGRVAVRLSMRVAQIEGRRDALVFLRLVREFGGY